MFERVELEITHRCNLNCIHCYLPYLQKTRNEGLNELTTNEIYLLIDQISLTGIPEIHFTGGEPLMRKDIIELMRYSHKKGLKTVLETNGTLIDEEMARRIKDSGVFCVKVSLDGLYQTFEKIRGKNMYEKVINGIVKLKNIGQSVEVDVAISQLNKNQINEIIDIAHKLSVNYLKIRLVLPIDEDEKYNNLLLSPQDILKIHNKVQEKKKQYKNLIIHDDLLLNESIERLVTKSFTIDPYGYVRPYPFSDIEVGNIRHIKLNKILERLPSSLSKVKMKSRRIQEYFDRIQNYLSNVKIQV